MAIKCRGCNDERGCGFCDVKRLTPEQITELKQMIARKGGAIYCGQKTVEEIIKELALF
ncbi:MAG: hypothetical protein US61_C0038G0004 [Parcubacteria group bacterium GW2011_GWE2_37_8]|nr:MAG: hypothetical protein US61_C0038G0004 [Parcubacteria group bacterium GW2011_GWE2_37_8]